MATRIVYSSRPSRGPRSFRPTRTDTQRTRLVDRRDRAHELGAGEGQVERRVREP